MKVRTLINSYEEHRATYGGKDVDNETLGTAIKWTRDLKRQLRLDTPNIFDRTNICQTLYRPFTKKTTVFQSKIE